MERIHLNVEDGTQMQAFVSRPSKKPLAAIIVLQEAFGVNNNIKEITKTFAQEDFLAIAPELYHRTAPEGFTCNYKEFQMVTDHISALTEKGIIADVKACYDWLTTTEHCKSIAAIGYCMGGRAVFIANSSIPLSCAISYYGGRIAPALLSLSPSQKSPLLFFWGGLDKHIPSEQIHSINQALTEAHKKFISVEISSADHGFFCNERASYNAEASRQSWALCLQFLKDYNRHL
ncbi:MAG: dienelactone hydrolase family protein [Pseudobdellovibrionaceae bacterium]